MVNVSMTPEELPSIINGLLLSPQLDVEWTDSLTEELARDACEYRELGNVSTMHERVALKAFNLPLKASDNLVKNNEIRRPRRISVRTPSANERSAGVGAGTGKREAPLCGHECDSRSRGTRVREYSPASQNAVKILLQWNIHFSGKRGSDADAFLLSLRESGVFAGVRHAEIFDALRFVLSGDALIWYEMGRPKWAKWREFENAFRSRFAAPNLQPALHREIMMRKQCAGEPVIDYTSCMRTLFGRLEPPWALETQLDHVHKNMLPRYQSMILRENFDNFRALERLAFNTERHFTAIAQYRPSPPPERTLKPPAAHKPPPKRARSGETVAAAEELGESRHGEWDVWGAVGYDEAYAWTEAGARMHEPYTKDVAAAVFERRARSPATLPNPASTVVLPR